MTAQLFGPGELASLLWERRRAVHQRLQGWDHDDLLLQSEADIIEVLKAEALIECPVLDPASAYMDDHPTELIRPFTEFGDTVDRRVARFTLVIPFVGDAQVFELCANGRTSAPPRGLVRPGEVRVFYTTDGITTPAAEQIKAGLRAELDKVEQYLELARGDIRAHQGEIESTLPGLVTDRRAQLLSDRQLNASIGFPVKRRGDADTYTIPIRRTRLAVRAASKTPTRRFTPEPALADDDYEAALAVLLNARNAFERTPSMTATLHEEQIRDLLLLLLNAQFEGAAAGEVFNRAGKTDILIRVEDRNVFIGECKFYDGPKVVASALDQLLGYLAWRDTKAALLLLIRDSDVTTVTAKAVQKIKEHPNHKRAGAIQTEERVDFVLHANGDEAREIRLALLPVLVGGTKRRTTSRLRRALEVPGTVLGSGAQPPAASP